MNFIKPVITTLIISASLNSHAAPLVGDAKATAHQAAGLVNQTMFVICNHSASVTNNTNVNQSIRVTYTVCADNQGCDTKSYHINVGSSGWHDSIQTSLYVQYKRAGHYHSFCKTSIKDLASQEDQSDIWIN